MLQPPPPTPHARGLLPPSPSGLHISGLNKHDKDTCLSSSWSACFQESSIRGRQSGSRLSTGRMHEPILLWCRRNNGANRTVDSLCGWRGRSLPKKQRETHASAPRRETLTPALLHCVDYSRGMMNNKRQSVFCSLHPPAWQRIYAGLWRLHPKGQIKHNLDSFTMGWHVWKLLNISLFFHLKTMNHDEYKLGNKVAVVWFNEFGGRGIAATATRREKQWRRSRSLELGAKEHLLRTDTATCGAPTNLNVCLLVSWHLSEAERRDVAPHAKRPGDASARVAGIYQVCREGKQPAQKRQHCVVNTGLCTRQRNLPTHNSYCSDRTELPQAL